MYILMIIKTIWWKIMTRKYSKKLIIIWYIHACIVLQGKIRQWKNGALYCTLLVRIILSCIPLAKLQGIITHILPKFKHDIQNSWEISFDTCMILIGSLRTKLQLCSKFRKLILLFLTTSPKRNVAWCEKKYFRIHLSIFQNYLKIRMLINFERDEKGIMDTTSSLFSATEML